MMSENIYGEKRMTILQYWGVMIATIMIMCLVFANLAEASDENEERFCLAQNIYFEAGNQPEAGKVAVANVTMNRVNHASYPDTICSVVYQAKIYKNWKNNIVPIIHMCQFSWFCDGKSDTPTDSATWMDSLRIASFAIEGRYFDVTSGATHYHNDWVYPYWAEHLNETVIINNHTFYK